MKKFISILLCFLLCFIVACDKSDTQSESITTFYEKVSESQQLLDTVADSIYDNWHGAIYDDEFSGDINVAILSAQIDHSDDLAKIEETDVEISELFKIVKETKHGELVKKIMSAYSDYYEFVVNVSGSFKSYSSEKETLKKELASLLRDLSYEL